MVSVESPFRRPRFAALRPWPAVRHESRNAENRSLWPASKRPALSVPKRQTPAITQASPPATHAVHRLSPGHSRRDDSRVWRPSPNATCTVSSSAPRGRAGVPRYHACASRRSVRRWCASDACPGRAGMPVVRQLLMKTGSAQTVSNPRRARMGAEVSLRATLVASGRPRASAWRRRALTSAR